MLYFSKFFTLPFSSELEKFNFSFLKKKKKKIFASNIEISFFNIIQYREQI